MSCGCCDIRECLADAGLTAEEIEEFLRLEAQKNVCGQLKILAHRRETLLDAVHEAESKLRCLDYIAYKLRSGEEL